MRACPKSTDSAPVEVVGSARGACVVPTFDKCDAKQAALDPGNAAAVGWLRGQDTTFTERRSLGGGLVWFRELLEGRLLELNLLRFVFSGLAFRLRNEISLLLA